MKAELAGILSRSRPNT